MDKSKSNAERSQKSKRNRLSFFFDCRSKVNGVRVLMLVASLLLLQLLCCSCAAIELLLSTCLDGRRVDCRLPSSTRSSKATSRLQRSSPSVRRSPVARRLLGLAASSLWLLRSFLLLCSPSFSLAPLFAVSSVSSSSWAAALFGASSYLYISDSLDVTLHKHRLSHPAIHFSCLVLRIWDFLKNNCFLLLLPSLFLEVD